MPTPSWRSTEGVDEVCRAHDRDPATVLRSNGPGVLRRSGRTRRSPGAGAIGREVDELRSNGLAGTPDEVIATVEALRADRHDGCTCRCR